MVWSIKAGSLHSPEIGASVLPAYRDSKALGILRTDDSAVSLCNVSTIDVLHTTFLQSSVQNKKEGACVSPSPKGKHQRILVLSRNPHGEHSATVLWIVDFTPTIHEVWTKDESHASSFLTRKTIVGHTKEGFVLNDRHQRSAVLITAKTQSTGLWGKSLAHTDIRVGEEGRLHLRAMTTIVFSLQRYNNYVFGTNIQRYS